MRMKVHLLRDIKDFYLLARNITAGESPSLQISPRESVADMCHEPVLRTTR